MGEVVKVEQYENGVILRGAGGRFLPGTTAKHTITQADASKLAHRRQELKRERLLAGAAKTLEKTGEWQTPSDLDVVEAIGEAVMVKAMNPYSAKQVDAARFVLQEAGLAENRQQEAQQGQQSSALLALVAQLMERDASITLSVTANDADNSNYQKHTDTVDNAQVSEN